MQEFREKRRLRELLYSRPSLIILFILVLFAGRGVFHMYEKYAQAAVDKRGVESQVALLSAREDFLVSEVERLKTPTGIEQEIRQKFNVKKEGEQVAVIVEPKDATGGAAKTSGVSSVWSWVVDIFSYGQ